MNAFWPSCFRVALLLLGFVLHTLTSLRYSLQLNGGTISMLDPCRSHLGLVLGTVFLHFFRVSLNLAVARFSGLLLESHSPREEG
jgi:hypothetical protein